MTEPLPSTSNGGRIDEEAKRAKARERKARSRAKRSEEKKDEDRAKNREIKKTDGARERDRNRKAKFRENLQEDEAAEVRERARNRMAQFRENLKEDETAEIRERDRLRKQLQRKLNETKVKPKDGLRSVEILNGSFTVPLLEDSKDAIGKMDVRCEYCGAFKFKKESAGFCCSNGKVLPKVFPRPPEQLMKLFFPHGTFGWNPSEKHTDGKRRITTREFFCHHLQVRENDNENYLHRASRLFQEFCCMGWVTTENQRLNYQAMNQKALRADSYKNVREATEERIREAGSRADAIHGDDHHQQTAVGRKILASSFSGGVRFMNSKFQDGMAIARKHHKPDFFITMTTNPLWPEIQNELLPGQTPQDRPDLITRVYKLKKDQLLHDLVKGELFGKVAAHLHVTEWQKRGLPHMHALIIVPECDRNMTPEFVDSIVTAELPPSPNEADNPTEKAQKQRLQNIVVSNMLHGPCGERKPDARCMENGRCTKNFPKAFNKQTHIDPDGTYVTYKRRSPEDGGRTVEHNGRIIHNGWVVPYNVYLSLRKKLSH